MFTLFVDSLLGSSYSPPNFFHQKLIYDRLDGRKGIIGDSGGDEITTSGGGASVKVQSIQG